MKVKVLVTLKDGVLDSQGKAIENALLALDFDGIKDVKAGKLFVLDIQEDNKEKAHEQAKKACELLLVNSVIESYEIE